MEEAEPNTLVVAVDGTSGSGKSSTSRAVAGRLGLRYLDTGAMYRAVTWWMLEHGVDVHDASAVARSAAAPRLVSGTDPAAPTITVDGTDVSVQIRTDAVNAAVSPVSAVPEVRERLVALQRAIIATPDDPPDDPPDDQADDQAADSARGIVVEGRDIGSVVWPQARLKVYLTADDAARAARRAAEAGSSDVEATRTSLLDRDRIDSGRAVAPLTRADGAVHVDTTELTLDQVVDLLVDLVAERAGGTADAAP